MGKDKPERQNITIRPARLDDAAAIARIYNEGIRGRNATYEVEERTPEERAAWLAAHNERHPVLIAEAETGILGWANISTYRPRRCYDGVGEFSIYIASEARGQGIGKLLLDALITTAEDLGYWKLLSRVFTTNTASRALCRRCGFREVGTYRAHAPLDGIWRDVIIVERLIPANIPVYDGDRDLLMVDAG